MSTSLVNTESFAEKMTVLQGLVAKFYQTLADKQREAETLAEVVSKITVKDEESRTLMSLKLSEMARKKKEIENLVKPVKDVLNGIKGEVLDHEKAALLRLNTVDDTKRRESLSYDREATRKRLEEESRIRQAQQKLDDDRRLAEAQALAAEGRHEEAEAVIDAPASPVSVVLPAAPKKPKDTAKKNWKVRRIEPNGDPTAAETVDNFPMLVKAVAELRVPFKALLPNFSWLDKQAKSMEELFNGQYPGCSAVNEEGLQVRK